MSFVTLDSVSAATPDGRPLFENLNLVIGAERIGLVGRNGAGKSTLLALIAGARAPLAGTITRTGTVATLDQTPDVSEGARLVDLLGVGGGWDRLSRIERGEGDETDLSDADWDLPARLDQALADVGLPGLEPERPAAALSGGQATRAGLARLLVARPDVLLLDEPTNNLDAEARGIVARVLARWRGGAVVVSHDRSLLRGMDRIVELSSLGARSYGGGWDLYAARRAEEAEAAQRGLDHAEQAVRRVAREAQVARERKDRRDAAGRKFADRGGTPKIVLGMMAERAENSGAREGRLADKLVAEAAQAKVSADARVERVRTLGFDLPSSGLPEGRTVLSFDDVAFAWPDEAPVIKGLSFRIAGPERVAVSGPNGTGKTTLIRLATGDLAPLAGVVKLSVPVALLDQRAGLLNDGETILENFRRLNPAASQNDAHAALARFLFRNTAAHQLAGTLSGGERLRAALACVLSAAAPPQLLILDEPTNHLDIASIEAVEAALSGYDGALLVVSHDADFLEAIGIERKIALG
ncbi:ABC-F family ATP-binding cassette domain-containing protein [Caulobacter sp. RL271]|jgi:ATPase subunit of ABC transporter with duplicated ATPase domains|uniref:ATP-binding cassette domain-containing protein n=1 Tax=Caulobacter segnis TaxID=88688 RepID=A0ABY4ZQ63_9CAUL|nr:ABC-F family ATP-binding cassette domain-containing protein [Caulobacter segnis]USQ94675.1 ATP-binding cassette domain-containing protein [Caulobacter segnis]